MPRFYSDKFLLALFANESEAIEVRLAKLCVKANLPATYVAKALGVSRIAVFNWFNGVKMKKAKYPIVEAFIRILQADFDSGTLPVPNLKRAKHYIETMVGREI